MIKPVGFGLVQGRRDQTPGTEEQVIDDLSGEVVAPPIDSAAAPDLRRRRLPSSARAGSSTGRSSTAAKPTHPEFTHRRLG
jgi:hypothetical protein